MLIDFQQWTSWHEGTKFSLNFALSLDRFLFGRRNVIIPCRPWIIFPSRTISHPPERETNASWWSRGQRNWEVGCPYNIFPADTYISFRSFIINRRPLVNHPLAFPHSRPRGSFNGRPIGLVPHTRDGADTSAFRSLSKGNCVGHLKRNPPSEDITRGKGEVPISAGERVENVTGIMPLI